MLLGNDGAAKRVLVDQLLGRRAFSVGSDVSTLDCIERQQQFAATRRDDAQLIRRRRRQHAILVGHPLAGETVHFRQRYSGQEPGDGIAIVLDARRRLRLQERRHVGFRIHVRVCLIALRVCLLYSTLQILPGAIELRLQKAESSHALAFGEQRVESARNSIVSDDRRQREGLGGPHEVALHRVRGDERWVWLLCL